MSDLETLDIELNQPAAGKVPPFLKVLCILSWVMSGLMILVSSIALLAKSTFINLFETAAEQSYDEQGLLAMEYLIENYNTLYILPLFAYALSAVAVYFMYKLQKVGFFAYCAIHIGVMVLPYLITTYPEGMIVGMGSVIWSLALLIGFIVMYGLNVKHMK